MCLGIPMQVISSEENIATCTDGIRREIVDISLVGKQPPGNWLLVFLGAAREVLTDKQAIDTQNALRAIELVMAGKSTTESINSLFADLNDREPYLPEHLKENKG